MSETKQLHRIIEGAIFAASEPLTVARIAELFTENDRPGNDVIRAALQEISDSYQERGIELKELASGYQFQVKADLASWIKRLWEERPPRYSRALLETLALIAYRQPITRGEIEEIRGVAVSSPMVKTLMEREWVRIVGHRDVPGKPALYATTKKFLDYFGLKSLTDLPPLAEIRNLEQIGEQLQGQLQAQADTENLVAQVDVQTDAQESQSPIIDDAVLAETTDEEITDTESQQDNFNEEKNNATTISEFAD